MAQSKDVAVMVSGGIDSFVTYRLSKSNPGYTKVIPIFVNVGQPYYEKEKEVVYKLYGEDENFREITADLCTNKLNNVPDAFENREIKGRNLLLAFYGALVADTVFICSLETEMYSNLFRDEQSEFYHMCSALFTFTLKKWKNNITVTTPVGHLSKSELVANGLTAKVVTADDLKSTVSCYDGKDRNCGKCYTCLKRWVAMTNNGISEDYTAHPWLENEYARKVEKQIEKTLKTGDFSIDMPIKRILEFASAVKLAGINTTFKV